MARYKWKDCDGYLPGWHYAVKTIDNDIRKFNGHCYIVLNNSIDHFEINGEYWKRYVETE